MHILELPVDIWVYLLLSVRTCIKPNDVVSLSQTCTQLHCVISGKNLWWSLLRAACAKDDVYLPSFEKDEMSERQIKRAALAPSRMADIIGKIQVKDRVTPGTHPRPKAIRNKMIPVSKYILPYTPNRNILAMVLLPGGRFLFTKTKDEILVIDVQRKEPPLPQMRHKTMGDPRFANWIFLLGPSLDGSKFRIASIDQYSASGLNATIVILEFDPRAASLTQIASRAVSQDRAMTQTVLHGDTLCGNLYAFFDPSVSTIYIWDFVRDMYMYWKVEHTSMSHELVTYKKLMIDYPRKLIMLVTDVNVLIWDLEHILTTSGSGRLDAFRPIWALPFCIRYSQHPYRSIPRYMRSWATFISVNISYYTHCPIPGFDVLIYDDLSKGGKIYSYEFIFEEKGSSSATTRRPKGMDYFHPRVSLRQAHDIPDYPTRDTGIKHNRFCDGRQVVLWEDYRAGLYTLIKASSLDDDGDDEDMLSDTQPSPIPSSTTGETFPHIRNNLVGVEMARYSSINPDVEYPAWEPHETTATRVEPIFGASTFDPVSGRMCSTSLDGLSIVVHDYLGEFGTEAEVHGQDGCNPSPSSAISSTVDGGQGLREAGRTVRKAFQSARNRVVRQPNQ